MIAVREFTNASDMMAHYRAVNARLHVQPKLVQSYGMNPVRKWQAECELAPPAPSAVSFDIPWYWGDISKLSTTKRVKAIKLRVSDESGVPIREIEGESRKQPIMLARRMAYAAFFNEFKNDQKWTLHRIGKEMGGKDSCSVLHGLRKAGVWGK